MIGRSAAAAHSTYIHLSFDEGNQRISAATIEQFLTQKGHKHGYKFCSNKMLLCFRFVILGVRIRENNEQKQITEIYIINFSSITFDIMNTCVCVFGVCVCVFGVCVGG